MTAPIHTGQFHLTLACQFDEDKQKVLESLVNNISLDVPVDWELQLYSRDKRTGSSKQVFLYPSFSLSVMLLNGGNIAISIKYQSFIFRSPFQLPFQTMLVRSFWVPFQIMLVAVLMRLESEFSTRAGLRQSEKSGKIGSLREFKENKETLILIRKIYVFKIKSGNFLMFLNVVGSLSQRFYQCLYIPCQLLVYQEIF